MDEAFLAVRCLAAKPGALFWARYLVLLVASTTGGLFDAEALRIPSLGADADLRPHRRVKAPLVGRGNVPVSGGSLVSGHLRSGAAHGGQLPPESLDGLVPNGGRHHDTTPFRTRSGRVGIRHQIFPEDLCDFPYCRFLSGAERPTAAKTGFATKPSLCGSYSAAPTANFFRRNPRRAWVR